MVLYPIGGIGGSSPRRHGAALDDGVPVPLHQGFRSCMPQSVAPAPRCPSTSRQVPTSFDSLGPRGRR